MGLHTVPISCQIRVWPGSERALKKAPALPCVYRSSSYIFDLRPRILACRSASPPWLFRFSSPTQTFHRSFLMAFPTIRKFLDLQPPLFVQAAFSRSAECVAFAWFLSAPLNHTLSPCTSPSGHLPAPSIRAALLGLLSACASSFASVGRGAPSAGRYDCVRYSALDASSRRLRS